MKKIILLTVTIMLMAIAASAQAEVRAGSVSVTPFVGFYNFETDEYNFDNSYTMGLRAGYYFTRNLGVEGVFNFVKTDTNDFTPITNDDDVYLYGAGVEGLYHFFPTSFIVPFLAVGIGGINYHVDGSHVNVDDMTKLAFDYGAGLKLFLPDNIAGFFLADDMALRADIRHVIPINETYSDLMGTIGLNFAFGGEKKPVVKEKCIDSDLDGVCDNQDKCPNTPPDCKVDADGCPVDSDRDGVPDCRDKCPDTPPGCKVDKDGCPFDSDNDGVVDCLDKCPDTPPRGCLIGKDGCPLDSDKDGVNDCLDKCPDTPPGLKVDKYGCSEEKLTIRMNVEFDTDKAIVKKQYYNEIKKVADFMKRYPKVTATIEGHTDSTAPDAYNFRLSNNRAKSVRQYLIDKFGIDASRLIAKGYGETKPIATNRTKEGRQKNRRVQAVLETIEVK